MRYLFNQVRVVQTLPTQPLDNFIREKFYLTVTLIKKIDTAKFERPAAL